jgi:hypothetical protein
MSQSKPDESLTYKSEFHLPYDPDYITAYQLNGVGLSSKELNDLCLELRQSKRTFTLLEEAVLSDRHPYTIMILAGKIGMYIPPRKRVGLDAYNFFISNIHYYDNVITGSKPLTVYEVLMSRDRINFLMRFKDNEILRIGYKFSRNYSSRLEMIQNFITNNVLIHGEFKLTSNSPYLYSTKAKVIQFKIQNEHHKYSVIELSNILNAKQFSKLSLQHLKQQILDKLQQWKYHPQAKDLNSPQLINLLNRIETIISSL